MKISSIMKRTPHGRLAQSLAIAMGLTCMSLHAQIVSSGLAGQIRDTAGNSVAGASVAIVHLPTNGASAAVTNQFGRFSVTGLPVGGPYSVTGSADGYSPATAPEIYTSLGTSVDVTITLKSTVIVMEKFVATASRSDLDAATVGSGTTLSVARIEAQPTVNRAFADLMRSNPYVTVRAGSDRMTALGMNNKFNSISVDGARINDQFGLNASGLFSVNNPFAMESLEQFSVDLSPYDVRRSGFTGASVNAVTKSGTNTFHGSVYYIYTDDDFQGPDIIGANAGNRQFVQDKTYGYTLGGPILKNRLFFFANYDNFLRKGTSISPVFSPDAAALTQLQTRITQIATAAGSGVNFGSISGGANETSEIKRLLKLDWNITKDHRMTVRYSDTEGSQPSFGGLNSTAFSGGAALTGAPAIGRITALTSNFYTAARTEKVWAGQVFSNWSPSLKSQLSYSKVTNLQLSVSPVTFPEVRVYGVPGVDTNTGAPVSNGVVVFGTENSRHGNKIDVKSETYGGSADYTLGRFIFSGGFDHEKSGFLNLFRQSSYGVIGYTNVANFVADTPFAFTRSFVQSGFPIADVSEFEQSAVFGQVRTDLTNRLMITAGLRYDWMASAIAPTENAAFRNAFGISNAGTIDDTSLLAPRVGFNYALNDERTTQIRGGLGVILGRAPWVWLSNSYGGTGVGRFAQALTGTSTPAAPNLATYLRTGFDPANPIGTTTAAPPAAAAAIALAQPGLKLPSVMRGNLALDRKLTALGVNLTVEYIYSKNIDAMFTENLNLRPTTIGADGRQRFAGSAAAQPRIAGFQNVLRFRNVKEGGSRYWSIQLDRPVRNTWGWNVAYTRGSATEAQNNGSTTAGSNWQFNMVFNQNAVDVARSDFEIRDRVVAGLTKEFKYWRNLRTSASLFYEGRTGSPYSWVYSTDLNTDGFTANDLVAVPTGAGDTRFDFSLLTAAQLAGYLRHFDANGLSKFAGGYARKNAFTQPWQNRLDLRLQQEIPAIKSLKVKLFADFINFGSWLSRDLFNHIETLPIPTNTGLSRQVPGGVYNAAGRIQPTTPVGAFDAAGNLVAPSNSAIAINNGDTRWKIQFGARIEF